jgi:TP901 family phage tail tape measure protein
VARSSDIDVRLRLQGARRFQAEAAASGKAAEGMSKRLGRIRSAGTRLRDVGSSMTKGVTLPIVGVGVAAAKMSMDFDASMTKITALVGLPRREVAGMKNEVLGLAGETGRAPKELADALFFITSAGLKGKTAMGALSASAHASAAGLGETKTVADAVTSAMNAYGPSTLSAGHATDVMVGAVREGKMEASALAPVLGRVIPIAQAMGVSFDQVGASIASMTRTGASAAEATTAVRGILNTFSKESPKTATALQKLGLSYGSVRKEIRQKGLLATLIDLRKRMRGAHMQSSQLFQNVRANSGFLSLTGQNVNKNVGIFDRMRHSAGLTNKAFEAMHHTTKAKLEMALASMQVLLIQLGSAILPVLAPILVTVAHAIGTMATQFGHLPGPVKTIIVALVGFLVEGFTILAAGVAFLVSPIGLVIIGIAAMAAAVYLLVKYWGKFSTAVKIAIIAAAIVFAPITAGATILVFVIAMVIRHFHLIVTAVKWVAGMVARYVRFQIAIWRGIIHIVGVVVSWIAARWRSYIHFWIGVAHKIASVGRSAWNGVRGAVSAVIGWVRGRWNAFVHFFSTVGHKISRVAHGMWDGIKDAFRSAINAVIGIWDRLHFTIGGWGIDKGPIHIHVPKVTVGMPHVPTLAAGGLVTGFGSFISGDAGPELNTITPAGVVVQPLAAGGLGQAIVGGRRDERTTTVPVYLDGKLLTRVVAKHTADRKARE